MKQRWFIYIIMGLIFGVFDSYYQGFLSRYLLQKLAINSSFATEITGLVLIISIWLVPIIPITLYETRISKSRVLAALASSLTWCTSIVFYYLTNVVQLAFLGIQTRQELHISNHREPFFWENWKSVFWHDIVGSIVEWIFVALVGGFIIGFFISFIYIYFGEIRNVKSLKE